MNGWLVFAIVLILLVSGTYFGWYFYARWNASRNGLPPPSMNPMVAFSSSNAEASNYPGPAPTGIKGWIDTQVRKFKNRNNRYTTGSGYEDTGYGSRGVGGGRGAGSRLDPDEAWSSRVGDEAYYEEQELGLHDPPHAANQSANPFAGEPTRGRSRTRESYDEHLDAHNARNPFGDDAAASLRGVSPRPVMDADTGYHGAATTAGNSSADPRKKSGSPDSHHDKSPTESRRSVFREAI
ncbi:hypothetical protein COCCADRAFT_32940 [Bipolaris zeicola 26-R-13]|uniref:Acid phosphatase-like protein n=1 Tax=Cochliobolus carbonum (strain 26-R-13) TaxID=930089 RepID=W6YQY2_COCC2|nr:uncharacterized protein COCCADRAFT_32940 [Bipolaris zeicola 26-R-13]EUC37839.1 hypothetical protein COCCADRAFT_32940 [Bipolaris zeicola 26-R-13]